MKRGTTTLLAAILATTLATALTSCGHNQPAQITAFTSTPGTISAGASAKLSWTDTGTPPLTLTLDHGIGDVSGKTSTTVKPTTTTTYTLTASNTTGKATKTTTVTVQPAAKPPTIASFTAQPGTLTSGSSTQLTWSVSGTSPITLAIDQGVGNVTGKTTVDVAPTTTTTYTLTATNSVGSATATVTVTVQPPTAPSITSFTANPGAIATGATSHLRWAVSGSGGIQLAIDQGVGNVTGKTTVDVAPTTTTTYTLTATNSVGSDSKQLTVTVGTPVTVDHPSSSVWVAVQDGSGPWTELTTATSFLVTDPAGRYGVAWHCALGAPGSSGMNGILEVVQATTADATSQKASCSGAVAPGFGSTYTGSVANIPSGGSVLLLMGGDRTQATPSKPTFTLTPRSGIVLALALGFDSSHQPTTMVAQTIDVTGNGTWNPDMATGQPYHGNQLTTSNAPAGGSFIADGELYPTGDDLVLAGNYTSTSYAVVPSSLPASYFYQLHATGAESDGSNAYAYNQEMDHFVKQPASSENLTFPAELTGSTVSGTGGQPTVTWGPSPFGSSTGTTAYDAELIPYNTTTSSTGWQLVVTAGWLGTATSAVLPDPSGAGGWDPAWAYPSGMEVSVKLEAVHSNEPLAYVKQLVTYLRLLGWAAPSDGTAYQTSDHEFLGTY